MDVNPSGSLEGKERIRWELSLLAHLRIPQNRTAEFSWCVCITQTGVGVQTHQQGAPGLCFGVRGPGWGLGKSQQVLLRERCVWQPRKGTQSPEV